MHPAIARASLAALACLAPVAAAIAQDTPDAADLAAEIRSLKAEYESRIGALEAQLEALETRPPPAASAAPARKIASFTDNAFNPAIGVTLDGRASSFSRNDSAGIPGFSLGHEGERGAEGLSLGHTEATLSSNIDDKFYGNLTLGLGVHPGEPVELELEEAWVQTLPGAGLPDGLRVTAGRKLWTFGYLNELHAHGDDFADRPLPSRVFLDNAWNDDGVELSLVLPTDFYSEIGGGLFRGDDFPFGGSADGFDARTAWARIGGDIGRDSAWRAGAYLLDGKASGRGGGDAHAHEDAGENGHEEEEEHEEDEVEHEEDDEHFDSAAFFSDGAFTGDTRLWSADVRFTWAPTGNARESELILQGEYFRRYEKGLYALPEEEGHDEEEEEHEEGEEEEHADEHEGEERMKRLDGSSSGWYVQAVYKFRPRWRVGLRYARLDPPDAAGINHTPYAIGSMIDWTNSEFGRIRFQYNRESLDGGGHDNQFLLQYVMSLGAHAAHSF